MIKTEEPQEFQKRTAKVIPALIHIDSSEARFITAAEEPKRRITVFLDYPAVRQLGWFSCLLALVAVAAAQKAAAIPVGAIILCGLVVGFINAARWLLARKR